MAGVEVYYEDENIKISLKRKNHSNRCLIIFTGIGHGHGLVDIQREEFFSLHSLGMVIWVTDKQRSWGNKLDLEKISNDLNRISAGKDIFLIGNSMGGFLAILFSKLLNAKRVLSISPQFSVHKDVVPDEKRWFKYTRKISTFRYKDLDSSLSKTCDYAVLMGDDENEKIHSKLFERFSTLSNFKLIKVKNCDHNLAKFLKEKGFLNECIDAYFSGLSLDDYLLKRQINYD